MEEISHEYKNKGVWSFKYDYMHVIGAQGSIILSSQSNQLKKPRHIFSLIEIP